MLGGRSEEACRATGSKHMTLGGSEERKEGTEMNGSSGMPPRSPFVTGLKEGCELITLAVGPGWKTASYLA